MRKGPRTTRVSIVEGMPRHVASFVLLQQDRPISELRGLDPDRDWRQFVTTTSAWVLQTYLRLSAAGAAVDLEDRLPDSGIAIVGAGDYRQVLTDRARRTAALIAVPLGSFRRRPGFADVVIVQNPVEADGVRSHFVPHWPQPGLVPRDPARGHLISRIAYKGFPDSLDEAFRGEGWLGFLRRLGIAWLYDAVPYGGARTDTSTLQFPDYRQVDLIVAIRPPKSHLYPDRPATKLVNAWLAGVPAILGPESAYRALRRDPLDYIEAGSVEEARAAVERLIREPDLYLAMVAHGRARATEWDVAAVRRRWETLLFDCLPALASAPSMRRATGRPMWLRQVAGRWRWRWHRHRQPR